MIPKKIFKTTKTLTELYSLPLDHPALEPLRSADVLMAGIDRRRAPQTWGEGHSPTHLVFMVITGHVHFPESGQVARAGEFLLVPQGIPKRLSIRSGRLEALWFHLDDRPRWEFLRGSGVRVLPAPEAEFMMRIEEQLLRQTLGNLETTGRQLAGLLRHYFEQIVHPSEAPQRRELRLRLERLWQEVNRNLDYQWSVAALAGRVNLSPTHLHRCSLELFGASPMKMVNRLRLQMAAVLLRTSDMKLDELAGLVGYQTAYAFSDAFRRYSGQRPGAFRQRRASDLAVG